MSTRKFALLLACVYLGAGVLAATLHRESFEQFAQNRSALLYVIALAQAIAAATFFWLPKIQEAWEQEQQRLQQQRDERLDQMFRITNPRIRA